MIYQNDWFDAKVEKNDILGGGFEIGSDCFFRRYDDKFEAYSLATDAICLLESDEAKSQLKSYRDKEGKVIRASDQGYINWRYEIRNNNEDHDTFDSVYDGELRDNSRENDL